MVGNERWVMSGGMREALMVDGEWMMRGTHMVGE